MATFCVFTRTEAPQFAKLLGTLLDLPKKGVRVGGGIHVDFDTPPPNPCPKNWLGWTTRHVNWIAKTTNTGAGTDEFAIRVTAELAAAWQAKKNLLTPGQRAFVQSHLDSAADLAAEPAWLASVPQPGGGSVSMLVESEDVEPEP